MVTERYPTVKYDDLCRMIWYLSTIVCREPVGARWIIAPPMDAPYNRCQGMYGVESVKSRRVSPLPYSHSTILTGIPRNGGAVPTTRRALVFSLAFDVGTPASRVSLYYDISTHVVLHGGSDGCPGGVKAVHGIQGDHVHLTGFRAGYERKKYGFFGLAHGYARRLDFVSYQYSA